MSPFYTGARGRQKAVPVPWRGLLSRVLVLLLAAGLAPETLPQAPGSLTLNRALQAAAERSHALAAQEAAARSAQEMAVSAGQLPDPMVRFAVDNLPVDGPTRYSLSDEAMTMRSLGISQTFTPRDKRRARAAVFERKADTAQAARAMALSELYRDTALAWFDRHFQQQLVELLSRQREEARLQIEAAEAAYRGGRGPQADIFLAKSSVARIDDRIRQAEAQRDNAATTLARWVGDLGALPLGPPPATTQLSLPDHDLEHQLEQHPDIALMVAREAIARAEAEAARQDRRVDWRLSLAYSQRGREYSDMVSVGISAPLQWNRGNRQDRVVAAQLATAEQARAQREEMTREHLAETRRWLATWRSNLQRLAHYDATLVPLAGDATRAALAAYRGGRGELAGVLDARAREIDTRIERLGIERETAALWVALEYLTSATDPGGQLPAGYRFGESPNLEPQS